MAYCRSAARDSNKATNFNVGGTSKRGVESNINHKVPQLNPGASRLTVPWVMQSNRFAYLSFRQIKRVSRALLPAPLRARRTASLGTRALKRRQASRQQHGSELKKFSMGRGVSAVAGLFLMAAPNPATAAPLQSATVSAGAVDATVKPLGAATAAVATVSGTVLQARPAASVTVTLAPAIATEAAWL